MALGRRRARRPCSSSSQATRPPPPASARTTSASTAACSPARASSSSSAPGRRVLMVQPNYQFRAISDERRRSAHGARRVRALGPLGLHRSPPRRAIACWSTSPNSWSATAPTWPARLRPGSYRFERDPQLHLHADDAGLPEEHRDGSRADVRPQPAAPAVAAGGGGGGRSSRASAASRPRGEAASIRVHHSIVELPDANYKPRALRSALRLFGDMSYENYSAPLGRADDAALHPPPSAGRRRIRRRR